MEICLEMLDITWECAWNPWNHMEICLEILETTWEFAWKPLKLLG